MLSLHKWSVYILHGGYHSAESSVTGKQIQSEVLVKLGSSEITFLCPFLALIEVFQSKFCFIIKQLL